MERTKMENNNFKLPEQTTGIRNENRAVNGNNHNCMYSNLGESTANNNGSTHNRLLDQSQNPTQLICLNTTVPQNIAAKSLGDKHTPTRNSLRHSRMIVMNKHNKVSRKHLPVIIRNYKLVKSMKVSTIILGMMMSVLAVIFVLWTPTLTSMDYPYWSAVPVFFSGVIGCVFLGFCPRPYPGRKLGPHYHISKCLSISTTVISIVAAMAVLTVAVLHLVYIGKSTCLPHDKFNTTCLCSPNNNATSQVFSEMAYHYQDLSCHDIELSLKGLLLVSCLFNLIGIALEVSYLYVHWSSARKYVYTKVPLTEEITNS